MRLEATDIDADAPCLDSELGARHAIRAPDDLGGAEDLSGLDDGGAAQDGRHRQVKLIESLHTFDASECRPPAGIQFVSEHHGGRFSQPHQPGLTLHVFERDDQNPRRRALRLRRSVEERNQRERREGTTVEHRSSSGCRRFIRSGRPHHHRHQAALSATGGAACVETRISRDGEMLEHTRDRGRIKPAQRLHRRDSDFTEQRTPEIHRHRVFAEPHDGTGTWIRRADQTARGPKRSSDPPAHRQRPQKGALESGKARDRPVRCMFPGPGDNLLVDLPFAAEKTQYCQQRREPDGSHAETRDAQPVLVKVEPVWQQLRNGLVKARHEDTSDSRFTHRGLRRTR
jgi:hypothetical protein